MDHLKTGHFWSFEYRTPKLTGIRMVTVYTLFTSDLESDWIDCKCLEWGKELETCFAWGEEHDTGQGWMTKTQHICEMGYTLIPERDSLTVSALAFHAADPGSNPAEGDYFFN